MSGQLITFILRFSNIAFKSGSMSTSMKIENYYLGDMAKYNYFLYTVRNNVKSLSCHHLSVQVYKPKDSVYMCNYCQSKFYKGFCVSMTDFQGPNLSRLHGLAESVVISISPSFTHSLPSNKINWTPF